MATEKLLGEKYDEDDKKGDENKKDLHHQPSVRGDSLEVIQYLIVGAGNVQITFFYVRIDSACDEVRMFEDLLLFTLITNYKN